MAELRSQFDNEIQRVIDKIQWFMPHGDLELHLSITLEFALRSHGRFQIIQLDHTESEVHPLYNESLQDDRKYLEAVEFIADVDTQPEKQLLKRFGIDEPRSGVVFNVSVAWLRTAELTPRIGDHVVYEGIRYEIMGINRQPGDYVVNMDVPLYFQMYTERFREGD